MSFDAVSVHPIFNLIKTVFIKINDIYTISFQPKNFRARYLLVPNLNAIFSIHTQNNVMKAYDFRVLVSFSNIYTVNVDICTDLAALYTIVNVHQEVGTQFRRWYTNAHLYIIYDIHAGTLS